MTGPAVERLEVALAARRRKALKHEALADGTFPVINKNDLFKLQEARGDAPPSKRLSELDEFIKRRRRTLGLRRKKQAKIRLKKAQPSKRVKVAA